VRFVATIATNGNVVPTAVASAVTPSATIASPAETAEASKSSGSGSHMTGIGVGVGIGACLLGIFMGWYHSRRKQARSASRRLAPQEGSRARLVHPDLVNPAGPVELDARHATAMQSLVK
jgi:hypothetical protein